MLADLDMVAYKYIPSLRPQFTGLSVTVFPQAYAWSFYTITRVVLMQPVTIIMALDCITWGEIVVRPNDGLLLGRLELTIAKG